MNWAGKVLLPGEIANKGNRGNRENKGNSPVYRALPIPVTPKLWKSGILISLISQFPRGRFFPVFLPHFAITSAKRLGKDGASS